MKPPADRGYAYVLGKIRGEQRIFAYTLMPTAWATHMVTVWKIG